MIYIMAKVIGAMVKVPMKIEANIVLCVKKVRKKISLAQSKHLHTNRNPIIK